jgi:hypothetical protein
MSELEQNEWEIPKAKADLGDPSMSPVEFKSNPAIGWLRFFIALTPTAIFIGCVILASWLYSPFSTSDVWSKISLILGFSGLLFCAWFDSQFDVQYRMGTRNLGSHMIQFVLYQVLIIPAVLFAIVLAVFATCFAGFT